MKPSRKIASWFIAAVLLSALGCAISFWAFSQIKTAANARKHSFEIIKHADDFLAKLRDAETGQRGYLLTGDETFMAPYQAVIGQIPDDLAQLRLRASGPAAHRNLDALVALSSAKLTNMAQAIELYRQRNTTAALALISNGQGKQQMDAIRVEMHDFVQREESTLARHDAAFQSDMRRLFILLIVASALTLLFALIFVYLVYRQSQLQLKTLLHQETRDLLDIQEAMNRQLIQNNQKLLESEEKLEVTLNSIGDAVIATDVDACVTQLNPVAQKLTGWMKADAIGRPVGEVFVIVNKDTRLSVAIPVMATLEHGTVQGLANHTVLIARDGQEYDIADSCAPIRDRDAQVVGAVLVFRNVTEEYAVQHALRDSAALIQTVLNTVDDGIITIRADGGVIEKVNSAAERMFGYPSTEIIGQNFSLLIPELDQDQRNGSLEYYSASDDARASGQVRVVMGQRKNGDVFPLEIMASEMWLGNRRYFTGVLRDVTARQQAEAELLKVGALQNAIFNSENFSSIATDAKGVIQIFNVGAEHMLGYTAAEVMNKITPADISDPQELLIRAHALSVELDTPIKPGFEALVFKALRGIEDIYELTYIRKDGSRLPAMVSVTALRDDQNTAIGYLLIGTDNTARKRIEAERILLDQALQDKNTELENAKIVAEKANLAKSDFLSSMSHELRTPLSAILGFAQLIDSSIPPPTPTQQRSVGQILQAGWYLLELINEILDLALVESGKLSLSLESVSLPEVMHECETMVESQTSKGGIHLTFMPVGNLYVIADRTRIKQVLINLLSNAIKYNRAGGTVVVSCNQEKPGRIRINVRDTGEGLSEEKIAQLFQPFNRLGQESHSVEGTGIGLVMTKRLIELMGGEIGLESRVGEGSVFWVEMDLTMETLPANLPDRADSLSPSTEADRALNTLLYVEDNPANLMLIEDIIARRPDTHLLIARDGIQGVAMARATLPTVILMDINLPGISGVEALKILQADPRTAHIPVIALSANAMPRDIEKGMAAGFFRYLTKPIVVNAFLETLGQALEFTKNKVSITPIKDKT